MKVIADPHPVDAGLFRFARELHLLTRAELFTGQEVTDSDVRHSALVPSPGTPLTCRCLGSADADDVFAHRSVRPQPRAFVALLLRGTRFRACGVLSDRRLVCRVARGGWCDRTDVTDDSPGRRDDRVVGLGASGASWDAVDITTAVGVHASLVLRRRRRGDSGTAGQARWGTAPGHTPHDSGCARSRLRGRPRWLAGRADAGTGLARHSRATAALIARPATRAGRGSRLSAQRGPRSRSPSSYRRSRSSPATV